MLAARKANSGLAGRVQKTIAVNSHQPGTVMRETHPAIWAQFPHTFMIGVFDNLGHIVDVDIVRSADDRGYSQPDDYVQCHQAHALRCTWQTIVRLSLS